MFLICGLNLCLFHLWKIAWIRRSVAHSKEFSSHLEKRWTKRPTGKLAKPGTCVIPCRGIAQVSIAERKWWAESVDLNVWLVPSKGHLCDPLAGDRASQEHPFFEPLLGGCLREGIRSRDMFELEAGAHIAPQHPYKDFKTKGFFWPNVDWNGFTTWEGVGER